MNPDSATQFPLDRECLLPGLGRFPQLEECWTRSKETLRAIRGRLFAAELPVEIETIYVCGSMGRMEMLPASDCDLVVVTNNVEANSARGNDLHASVWKTIEPLGLIRPKRDGIFSQVVTREKLTTRETLGLVDEDQFVFGKRIQLLLDSQSVYREDKFDTLTKEILERYYFANATVWNESPWTGLLAELSRYYGSLKVRTLWISQQKPGTWRVLNAKIRHSRLVLIAGLMFVLKHASEAKEDSTEGLLPLLKRTPLERIAQTCAAEDDMTLVKFRSAYDAFLRSLGDPEFVSRLSDQTLSHAEVEQELTRLAESATEIRRCLLTLSGQDENLFLGTWLF